MLDQKTLDDIVGRIVEVAQPERIILFGSASRGDMGPLSDVDLLWPRRSLEFDDCTGALARHINTQTIAWSERFVYAPAPYEWVPTATAL